MFDTSSLDYATEQMLENVPIASRVSCPVYPSGTRLPENQLKLYPHFSASLWAR